MKSKKIVFSSDMEEIYKVIADFSITINLLFRIFSKQASTLAALTARGDGVIPPPDSGKIQKSSGKTARHIWVICLSRITGLQSGPVEVRILVA